MKDRIFLYMVDRRDAREARKMAKAKVAEMRAAKLKASLESTPSLRQRLAAKAKALIGRIKGGR